jgi:hypothetical protein
MAKKSAKKRAPAAVAEEGADVSHPALDKIAGLLALIATREMDTDSAALKLDACGFSAREISALLDVGLNYVNVARHRKKKK